MQGLGFGVFTAWDYVVEFEVCGCRFLSFRA